MDVDQFDAHTSTSSLEIAVVEFQNCDDDNISIHKKFINVLDGLDTRVEKLRQEAMHLADKRDILLMSMDILKHNELLTGINEYELEEIHCYTHRIGNRLKTVSIHVQTVRDGAQEEALHQVNSMIDSLITFKDRAMARQRCQMFLNACCVHDDVSNDLEPIEPMVDKKFENSVLGCTLDDQKIIKKRLFALMTYLNKQTISD